MSIAVDSSTPAQKAAPTSGSTVTSNTFSPPAGSVLLATLTVFGLGGSGQTVSSVSDSLGSHLTWAKLVQASWAGDVNAELWWASCPSSQTNMTVTMTMSSAWRGFGQARMGVVVMTGAATSQTGATNSANSNSGAPGVSLTTTANGSLVIGACATANGTSSPTIPSGQTDVFGSQTYEGVPTGQTAHQWVQTTTSPTSTSGTNVTINDTAPTCEYVFVAVEILAGSSGGSPTPLIAPLVSQAVNRSSNY